MNTSAYTLLW